MKKTYAPLIAAGLLLGVYACSKQSTAGLPDPQPTVVAPVANSISGTTLTSSAREAGTTVSKADLQDMFEHGLKDMEGSGLGLVIKHANTGEYTMQVVKQGQLSVSARTAQICKVKVGFSLYSCVDDYLDHHDFAVLTVNNCGDSDYSTWCVFDTNVP